MNLKNFMPLLPRFFQSLNCHGCSTKVPSGVGHPTVTYSLHLDHLSMSDVKKTFYAKLICFVTHIWCNDTYS